MFSSWPFWCGGVSFITSVSINEYSVCVLQVLHGSGSGDGSENWSGFPGGHLGSLHTCCWHAGRQTKGRARQQIDVSTAKHTQGSFDELKTNLKWVSVPLKCISPYRNMLTSCFTCQTCSHKPVVTFSSDLKQRNIREDRSLFSLISRGSLMFLYFLTLLFFIFRISVQKWLHAFGWYQTQPHMQQDQTSSVSDFTDLLKSSSCS